MSQPQTVVRHAASSSFRRAASGLLRLAAGAALSFALAACGGGGGGTPAPTPSTPASGTPVATYQVSGSLTGLSAGASVVLLVNGQALTVSQNGGFTTTASLPTGTAYSVTVGTQPTDETCVVSNGSGVIGTSNVINVTVACTVNPQATYTIGGTVSGLSSTLQLLDNSNDTVTVSSNGAFTFPQALFDQASYSVTLGTTQPAGQTCTIANGSGTVQGANVTSVQVSCVDNPPPPPPASNYTLGGTVSGLTGTVVLSQGTQSVSVSANGTYAFPTALASGASYAVTVTTQPTGQTCSAANGTGTVGSSNVTNVNVTCATNTSSYSIGGSLSGLTPGAGISVVLQDNAGDDLTLANNGTFTFATQIAIGATYNVTVKTQPTGQTCSVTSGSGTVGSSNVTGIRVTCAASPQFAYVANFGDNTVSAYSIDASTGALTVVGSPVATGRYPYSVTVNPAGTFAYVTNYGDNTVSVYAINSNGVLTTVGSPVSAGALPISIAVNPAGTFAYVANQGDNTVSAYSIDASGALIAVGSPAVEGIAPYSVAVDPTGSFAYVANLGSNTVSAYSINTSTGALTGVGNTFAASTDPFATTTNPTSVTVNPAGTFAYVANSGDDSVSAYSINATTGVLTAVGSPVAAGVFPRSVAVNPAGTFVYVANNGSNSVSAYSINTITGALTAVTGSPFQAGASPISVTVNPAGTFAYVANQGDNTVTAYRIDISTGALTAVGSGPFTAGTNPTSIVVVQPN